MTSMNGVDIQWPKSQRVATSERTNHKMKPNNEENIVAEGVKDLFLSFSRMI